MTNEVALVRDNKQIATTADDLWAEYATQHGAEATNVQYMKFDGTMGVFVYGADKSELEAGDQVVVDMFKFSNGFICWKDGKPIDEKMVSFEDRLSGVSPVDKDALPDYGPYAVYDDGSKDGWSEQYAVTMYLTDGTKIVYKAAASTQVRALQQLLGSYVAGRKVHGDSYPVVELGANSFIPKGSKKAGKKYAPTFKIVKYLSPEEFDDLQLTAQTTQQDDGDEAAQDEADTPPAVVKATPAPATAPASTTGGRGRRFA